MVCAGAVVADTQDDMLEHPSDMTAHPPGITVTSNNEKIHLPLSAHNNMSMTPPEFGLVADRTAIATSGNHLVPPTRFRKHQRNTSSVDTRKTISDGDPEPHQRLEFLYTHLISSDKSRRRQTVKTMVDSANTTGAPLLSKKWAVLMGWEFDPKICKPQIKFGNDTWIECLGTITLVAKFSTKTCKHFLKEKSIFWVVENIPADCILNTKLMRLASTIYCHAADLLPDHEDCWRQERHPPKRLIQTVVKSCHEGQMFCPFCKPCCTPDTATESALPMSSEQKISQDWASRLTLNQSTRRRRFSN